MQKRSCVQCGNEFFLQDSEIEFYESKNLNLPKRCKECRTKNKNSGDNHNRRKENTNYYQNRNYNHSNNNYQNNHYEKVNSNKSYKSNNNYNVNRSQENSNIAKEQTKKEAVTSQSKQNSRVNPNSKKNSLWKKIIVVIAVILALLFGVGVQQDWFGKTETAYQFRTEATL